MIYTPHDYQTEAIDFILSHSICCLCLDMGLGKTVCTLTALSQLIARGEVKKTLIVAPLRVARNVWPAEMQKWDHLQGLRCSLICGKEEKRKAALQADADFYIINRDNLEWLYRTIGTTAMFDTLVLDEMSSFKNIGSQRTQSMYFLRRQAKRVIALTGTPAPNGLIDLWSQYKILDDGATLGATILQYEHAFFIPRFAGSKTNIKWLPKGGAGEAIGRRISPITVSMKAKDHLDMPALYVTPVEVTLSEGEMEEYQDFKKDMVLQLDKALLTSKNALAHCTKLVQYANGTIYDEEGAMHPVHKRKLDALEDLIEQANGKPVLVACPFKHDRQRIMERLRSKGVGVRCLTEEEDFVEWNAGRVAVGLISPAGTAFGLNLQEGSNTLIWYGLTWNLELFQQTNARLWRQGQPSPFVVIRLLITKDTIDEKILGILMQKDKTQSGLLDAVRAEFRLPESGAENDLSTSAEVCENCLYSREDGGEGEDCGLYHVCCRPGRSRTLTQPGDSCSAFCPQSRLANAKAVITRPDAVSVTPSSAAGGGV